MEGLLLLGIEQNMRWNAQQRRLVLITHLIVMADASWDIPLLWMAAKIRVHRHAHFERRNPIQYSIQFLQRYYLTGLDQNV